jgi:hypothetical protein
LEYKNINSVVKQVLDKYIVNEKITIPTWVKRVKLDVGTSVNAPNSEVWLNNDEQLCVFGFEPNIFNVKHLYTGDKIWPIHLNPNKIDKSFFLINCALSDKISENEKFYCTDNDSGTSSLFVPIDNRIQVKEVTEIPVITLESFFDLFPWEIIEYIEQIKIDAQSSDFEIIKGIGNYLSDKIVYLDVETTTNGQYSNSETPQDLKNYLETKGFECLSWGVNATFINKKFQHIKDNINYSIIGD